MTTPLERLQPTVAAILRTTTSAPKVAAAITAAGWMQAQDFAALLAANAERRVMQLVCDSCGAAQPFPVGTHPDDPTAFAAARAAAYDAGWSSRDGMDLCPPCTATGKLVG